MSEAKAFIVQDSDDYSGDIYYAKSDIQAKRDFMGERGIDELAGVMCRRCPEMDDKARDPRARVEYLLSTGWWFDIGGLVTADDEPFVSKQGGVYHTWMQWLSEREDRATRRAAERQAELDLWGKWPWAEDIRAHIEPSGKVNASIKLPFMQGTLRWLEREGKHTIERRDLAVFRQAYTINLDAELSDE